MEDEIQTTAPQSAHKVLIPNHLAMAILVTVFCCMPFGIIAIIHACKTDAAAARGDVLQAVSHSNSAQNWSLFGIVIGFIFIISQLAINGGNLLNYLAKTGQI